MVTRVSIAGNDGKTYFTLIGNEENKDGISVSSIDFSDKFASSTVTLKKGTEFAKVEFDPVDKQTSAAAPVARQPNVPVPGNPGMARPRTLIPQPQRQTPPPPIVRPNAPFNAPANERIRQQRVIQTPR